MKRVIMLFVFCAAMVAVAEAKHDAPPIEGRADFGVFYSSLTPYGEWIDCDLGYVWRPDHVARGWRPYLYGRWVWTDYGWYWVSEEPFGWATFHYGRWYYDDYYGWIWIPDNVWGPSWVEWRYDNDYIGWAPLSPYASFNFNVGITYTNRWSAPYHYWNFIPCRSFTSDRVVDYVQPPERSRRIFGNTRSVGEIRTDNHHIVNRGVDVQFVERRADVHINRVEVVQKDRGDGDRFVRESNRERVEVYQPRLDGSTRGEAAQPPVVRRAERPIRLENGSNERRTDDRMFHSPPAFQRGAPGREREINVPPAGQQPGRRRPDPRRDNERVAPQRDPQRMEMPRDRQFRQNNEPRRQEREMGQQRRGPEQRREMSAPRGNQGKEQKHDQERGEQKPRGRRP